MKRFSGGQIRFCRIKRARLRSYKSNRRIPRENVSFSRQSRVMLAILEKKQTNNNVDFSRAVQFTMLYNTIVFYE